jgi:hypothetical protein
MASSTTEISNPVVLDMCTKLMSTLVKYIYYGVKDVKKYQYLVDKIKAIRSFNDIRNKRIKFILSEIIVNVENLIKTFKPISTNTNYNKTNTNYNKTNTPHQITILKNKEQLMNTLGITTVINNKTDKKITKSSAWHNLESSDDDEDIKGDDEDIKGDDGDIKGDDEDIKGDDEDIKGDDEDIKCDDEDIKCDAKCEDIKCESEDVKAEDDDTYANNIKDANTI